MPHPIITTLGRFDIAQGDTSLYGQAANAKKIWELFMFLFTYRDKSFTPEALADQLWPSEAYSDPRGTLRRQMHRLRQMLGESASETDCHLIHFTSGSYKWNQSHPLNADIDTFENHIKAGEKHLHTSSRADSTSSDRLEALKAFEAAIALYKGDYLPDLVDQHWIFSVRHHYRRQYLKAVTNALNLQKALGLHEAMVATAHSAIQIDIYEEHFHLMYMEALLQQGSPKQALEHYEHITRFFYQEMGISPSQDLKHLYKRLLAAPTTGCDAIFASLDDHGPIENAFFCDPQVFKSIYELERRRSQRSGNHFSVAILSLKGHSGDTIAQDNMRSDRFKSHLAQTLRLGDTFAQWGTRQYAVLLPGVDEALMLRVIERVLSAFADRALVTIERVNHLPALHTTATYKIEQEAAYEA